MLVKFSAFVLSFAVVALAAPAFAAPAYTPGDFEHGPVGIACDVTLQLGQQAHVIRHFDMTLAPTKACVEQPLDADIQGTSLHLRAIFIAPCVTQTASLAIELESKSGASAQAFREKGGLESLALELRTNSGGQAENASASCHIVRN